MKFHLPPGATPLDPDEVQGLIPKIATQGELNEFESDNIQEAVLWALGRGRTRAQQTITTPDGLVDLHRRMFDRTWKWAGRIRVSNKNIGVAKEQIRSELKTLCDDVEYQIGHDTYRTDELVIRFHHRLVSIHPFPNGNGRHGRMAADILLSKLGGIAFSWGGGAPLSAAGPARVEYLESLRAADKGELDRLIAFSRS